MTAQRPQDLPDERAHQSAAGWFGLFPDFLAQTHPWLEKLALLVFAFCVLGILALQQKGIRESGEAIPCPVSYPAAWQVDKPAYHAGDVIRFSYRRDSAIGDLLLWQVDSWENLDNGELYPGGLIGRYVAHVGGEEVRQVRQVPATLTPGTYRFTGWVSAQTSHRSQPAGYVSEPFRVVAKGAALAEGDAPESVAACSGGHPCKAGCKNCRSCRYCREHPATPCSVLEALQKKQPKPKA